MVGLGGGLSEVVLWMSALRHGFFRRGFMLCDRCVLNVRCESFVPGGECAVERRAFGWIVRRLIGGYGLEGLADEILVGRVAMYLVRIARAEVYEANVGVSDKSVVWGRYVAGLDRVLRGLLKDLALSRAERKKAEKSDVLVDVDRLLKGLGKRRRVARRGLVRRLSPMGLVLKDWRVERRRLSVSRGGRGGSGDEDS